MSFMGNMNGTKESETVERLGPNYFGITWEQLDVDISYYRDAERRNEIVPVRIDDFGEPYILFSLPDKKGQRFYLQKKEYRLYGKVLCITEKGERLYSEFNRIVSL